MKGTQKVGERSKFESATRLVEGEAKGGKGRREGGTNLVVVELVVPVVLILRKIHLLGSPEGSLGLLVSLPDLLKGNDREGGRERGEPTARQEKDGSTRGGKGREERWNGKDSPP